VRLSHNQIDQSNLAVRTRAPVSWHAAHNLAFSSPLNNSPPIGIGTAEPHCQRSPSRGLKSRSGVSTAIDLLSLAPPSVVAAGRDYVFRNAGQHLSTLFCDFFEPICKSLNFRPLIPRSTAETTPFPLPDRKKDEPTKENRHAFRRSEPRAWRGRRGARIGY